MIDLIEIEGQRFVGLTNFGQEQWDNHCYTCLDINRPSDYTRPFPFYYADTAWENGRVFGKNLNGQRFSVQVSVDKAWKIANMLYKHCC